MIWSVFFVVVLLNTSLCLTQYLVEQSDKKRGKIAPRHSIIPGTNQKILYWEDYYSQTYGDFLGLVWIMNGFAHLLVNGQITAIQWIIFATTSLAAALIFLFINLKPGHRHDWGWPAERKISWGGSSHLPYFGINTGMAIVCVIGMINGQIQGLLLWTTLAGGGIWIISAMMDALTGHFDPLKKVS
jgi:hypothetical protein